MKSLSRFLPWAVFAALFFYLFRTYPVGRLWNALDDLNVPVFLLYSVAYFLFIWIADCWSLGRVFTRFGYPTSARNLVSARMASYPVTAFNYTAAQGTFVYFCKKSTSLSLSQCTSLVSFTTAIDLYITLSLAFIGSLFSTELAHNPSLTKALWLLWGAGTVGIPLMRFFLKVPWPGKVLNWIRAHPVFFTFRDARFSDYGVTLAARFPIHLAVNTTLFFVARTFGVEIPLLTVLAHLPVVIILGTIPITPAGLGTIQIATVELFKDHAAPEILLTMSLLFGLVNLALKVGMGTFFLKGIWTAPKAVEDL